MSLSLTTADSVLKIDYQGPVREQLYKSHPLLTKVRKNRRNYVGKQAYIPLHVGRNVGIGNRAEGGTLPTAGNQQYSSATFTPVYHYGRILLNGPTISAMKSNKGAFLRAIQSEMKGLTRDLSQDMARQCWGDGSGVLTKGTAANTGSSTTFNCGSTKFLQPGMAVEIAEVDDGANAVERTISSITSDTAFVISSALDASTNATNWGVFRSGNRDSTNGTTWSSTVPEVWGLEAIVSSSNPGTGYLGTGDNGLGTNYFGGINRTGNNWWQANMLTNSGTLRNLTYELFQEALDLAEIESDVTPGMIFTSYAMRRNYNAQLISDKRFEGTGTVVLDGGYAANKTQYSGIPIYADRFAGTATKPELEGFYFVSMDALEWQVLEDYQWMQRDGAVLNRITDKDQYEATMFCYTQLGAEACNRHTFLGDIRTTNV